MAAHDIDHDDTPQQGTSSIIIFTILEQLKLHDKFPSFRKMLDFPTKKPFFKQTISFN